MTKKIKVFLIALLGAVIATCTLVGCKVGTPTRSEILQSYKGGHVTYYANGGTFDSGECIRELYFKKEGTPFYDIDESTSIKISRAGYDFIGWYLAETYSSGEHQGEVKFTYTYKVSENSEEITEPVYYVLDGRGNIVTDDDEDRPLFHREGKDEKIKEKDVLVVASDTLVTSERLLTNSDNLTVCAKWKPALKIEYRLSCDANLTLTAVGDETGKTYKNGDLIAVTSFGRGETATPAERSQIAFAGTTFVKNYLDEACTQPITAIPRPEGENPANPVVYCKYLEGSWTIIDNDPKAVENMFKGLSGSNKYYLVSDVDCSNVSIAPKPATGFTTSITIEGNGHTISNLNFSSVSQAVDCAVMFGTIGSDAVIKNLKIDGVNISLTGKRSINAYAICKDIADGATVENLEISNITMDATKINGYCYNTTNKWLFGTGTSDNEFLTAHTGITISGTNTPTGFGDQI
ncbi:MAG: hypothetical protein ACI4MS_03595 [Candidatus Coproplasma sp.]